MGVGVWWREWRKEEGEGGLEKREKGYVAGEALKREAFKGKEDRISKGNHVANYCMRI